MIARLFLVVSALLISTQSLATEHKITDVEFEYMGHGILRTTLSIQVGENTLNQFKVKRVRKIGAPYFSQKPLIYLSPLGVDSREYEIIDSSDYRDTFLGNLALNNIDVWAIDDRVNYHPAEDCNNGTLNCQVMAGWGFEQRAEDTEFIRKLLKRQYRFFAPHIKPALGGHVGGGAAAITIINASPDLYSGLFSSGATYLSNEADQNRNLIFCNDLKNRLSNGESIDTSLAAFVPMVNLLRNDPEGDSPFAPVLTNRQFFISVASTPGALGPLALSQNYVFAQGDVFTSEIKYMNLNAFYQHFDAIGTTASLNAIKQFSCSAAGEEMQYYNNLGAFTGIVEFIGGPQGMGPHMQDTALLFSGASSLTVTMYPYDGGEVDQFLIDVDQRKQVYDQRVIDWMNFVFDYN